jgi:preprotein translocase subunit YajC
LITSTILAPLLIAQAEAGGSSISWLLPIVIMGGLFYVLLIMPQRRRKKKMETMRKGIGIGSEVRTIGGIVGTVVDEDDETFTLDLGGSTMRIVKRAIAERTDSDDE